jgi:hypothetical protein
MIKNIPVTAWRDEHFRDITVSKVFVYELSAYAHYKDRIELLGSKFVTSSNPLKERIQITKKIGYRIVKSIDLISAPLDYIINNSNFIKL